MLSAMLNTSEKVISPSEEPFLIYLSDHYGSITKWSDDKIDAFVDDVFLLHDKNVKIYMEPKEEVKSSLKSTPRPTNYLDACKQVYLQFYPEKDKHQVTTIVDKQIKYTYYTDELVQRCPESKFVILVRNPLDNLSSWRKRNMGSSQHALYLSEVWRSHYNKLWQFHEKHPNKTLLLNYEDLVTDPETKLKQVCAFLGIKFQQRLIEFQHQFNEFSRKSRSRDPKFIERLDDFHSGLKKAVNTANVNIYSNHFEAKEQHQIRAHCAEIARKYGYDLQPEQKMYQYGKWWWVFRARWSKINLLKMYRWIPLNWKKQFRKRRAKHVDA